MKMSVQYIFLFFSFCSIVTMYGEDISEDAVLDLSHSQLYSSVIRLQISRMSDEQCSKIKILSLADNEIKIFSDEVLRLLRRMKNLEELDLSTNLIGSINILDDLPYLPHVRVLRIDSNPFLGNSYFKIPMSLPQLDKIDGSGEMLMLCSRDVNLKHPHTSRNQKIQELLGFL